VINGALSNTICCDRVSEERRSCRAATNTFTSIIPSIKVRLAERYAEPAIVLRIERWDSGACGDTHVSGRISIHVGSGSAREDANMIVSVSK
jgi:hypothetical protein